MQKKIHLGGLMTIFIAAIYFLSLQVTHILKREDVREHTFEFYSMTMNQNGEWQDPFSSLIYLLLACVYVGWKWEVQAGEWKGGVM